MDKKTTLETRAEVAALLAQTLAEMTDNRLEDVKEESLIYGELNLTEYDLQRIINLMGTKLEIDAQSLSELISGNDEIVTVSDVLDLIMDEKELG